MARQLIFFVIALAVSTLGAPAEEAVKVPENTQVSGEINVKAPLVSSPSTQLLVQDKQKSQEELQEQDAEGPLVPIAPVLTQEGEPSLDLQDTAASPEGDKSDLDTANTWGWGWRRRGYGWGGGYGGWGGWGGYGGGYYRPYWGGGYYPGHGWGRGWGHGYGYWG